jgi:D-threo-aldose 1-dehydrogenase
MPNPREHRLGSSALNLGPVGLGVAPLGNLYAPVSDTDADATLAAAERCEFSWFDVAPLYGYGLAEERLGRFLKQSENAGIVATKVGRVLEPTSSSQIHEHFVSPLPNRPVFDYSTGGIERSYEESLRRLGLDRVQILLLHDIDRAHHPVRHRAIVQQLLDEALPTLQRLKADGRVDAIGLGIGEWDIGYEILANAEIDCVLLAGRYTLLDQSAFSSGFLDACSRRGVGILAGGVFNSGFLAGGSTYDYHPASDELCGRRDLLSMLCNRYDVPLAAVALQFTAANPAIVSIVVGARSPEETEAIMNWRKIKIPTELWSSLRTEGLIPSDAPLPDESPEETER